MSIHRHLFFTGFFTASPKLFLSSLLCGAVLFPATSMAASNDNTGFQINLNQKPRKAECLPQWIAPVQPIPGLKTDNTAEADVFYQTDKDTYKLSGNVALKQPGLVILADKIKANRTQSKLRAFGDVQLQREDFLATGQAAEIDDKTKTARLSSAKYQFKDTRSHGAADTIEVDQNTKIAHLENATFTTCPLVDYAWQERNGDIAHDKKYAWELDFGHLEINDQTRRIYGHNTFLYFQTVPVFYTPYINFPMDDRASGFLFPTFGSYRPITRDVSETYVKIPYYFNIAPNFDDTLTVMKMQDRGWVLENEFRYLQPNHSAALTLTGLNDQVTKDTGLGYIDANGDPAFGEKIEERWRAKLIANQQWAPGLTSNVLWHEVSDENFYADIPVEPTLDTVTNTERHVKVNYNKGNFQAGVQMLDYLRLRKNAPYNYEKRPEVTLNYYHPIQTEGLENWSVNLGAEAAEFEVTSSGHNKPEGLRTYLSPSIKYELLKPYGSLTAEMVANKVHYQMQDNANNTPGVLDHDITVPQYALKGGLVFERDLDINGFGLVQTLEPQVQYLYVPYQDQNGIPLFDTTVKSLDFSNLFDYNRYSGYDRIGDTNQVSAALVTRFLKPDGTPLFDAGLGQIFYFSDRKITLTDPATEAESQKNTQGVSDYFVKLGATMGPFTFATTNQLSNFNYELTNSNSRLKLDLTPRFKLLMTNTLSKVNTLKQEDLAAGFNWQINDEWTLGSYVNYDFTKQLRSEIQHALRYDSCCWASEFSVKETQLDNGLYNYSLQFVIELKGLSTVGTPFTDYLSNKLNF